MGLVAEGRTQYACLALRPVDDIPEDITRGGSNFGHSVRGTNDFEVVHFGFEFYGYRTFNALINPSNEIAKTIRRTWSRRRRFSSSRSILQAESRRSRPVLVNTA